MRNEFTEALVHLAARDDRVVLLTGDLGYTVLEPFSDRFPDRFFNAGVAEQNMVGVATGLAEAGLVPFVYSIATFASMRPYEFIRNGPALHRLPVRIVGVGGGFDYGQNGATHYALEDVGLMRIQPEVTVVAPFDADQCRHAVDATADLPRPVYFRIGKDGTRINGLESHFELGRAVVTGDGDDIALIALGTAAKDAVAAAELLRDDGLEATVAAVSSFNPGPDDDVAELLSRVPVAIVVENHYAVGGLSSFVSEVVAERGLDCRVIRAGVTEMPDGRSGTPGHLHQARGLTPEALARKVAEAVTLAER